MTHIHVCSLARIAETVERTGASHLLTVINQATVVERPPAIPPERHVFVGVNDITEPQEGLTFPEAGHLEQIIAFVRGWDREKPMVIHCFAGISRSTASAFIAACLHNPGRDELEIARALRAASPTATPNARFIALADEILGRQGRMVAAVAAIGRGAEAMAGEPFELRID